MAVGETVPDKDLRALMVFIEEGRRAESDGPMPWCVLRELRNLVRCDYTGFTEFDNVGKIIRTQQFEDSGGIRELERAETSDQDNPYWTLSLDFLPCQYLIAKGNQARVLKFSDFYTIPELINTSFYGELNKGAVLRRMTISLPAAPGHSRRVHFDRESGRDFSERDRMIAEILRPHLYEIYLAAERRQREVPRLSNRELQVLRLAGQGMSNAEIAKDLYLSVGTVRKHLEHVFDRTGVRNRAAAAALVLPHLSTIDPY